MNGAEWVLVVLACIAGAVSPGPSLMLVMRHALVSPRAGLICAWAHACGVAVYAGIAVTGLALLLSAQGWIMTLLWALSALWLFYLALASWRSDMSVSERAPPRHRAARDGLIMALANPKVMVFFMALFAAAIPADAGPTERGLAVLVAFMVDGLWYALVSAGLQFGPLKNTLLGQLGLLSRLSAVILAGFGAVALLKVMNP